jgi:hypothetical protein
MGRRSAAKLLNKDEARRITACAAEESELPFPDSNAEIRDRVLSAHEPFVLTMVFPLSD